MQHENEHRQTEWETDDAEYRNTGTNGIGSVAGVAETSTSGGEASDEAEGKRIAAGAKMAAAAFGEITAMLMRSPGHKHFSLADLEWLLLPAVVSNQFAVAGTKAKGNAAMTLPVGVAFWARVSDEVDQELSSNLDRPLRLRPDQWSSGDNFWLIDVVATAEVGRALINQLSRTVFVGKSFKMRTADADGNRSVRVMKGAVPNDAEKEDLEEEAPIETGLP